LFNLIQLREFDASDDDDASAMEEQNDERGYLFLKIYKNFKTNY